MTTTEDQRTAYIKGLRHLATLLERHAEIPLPVHGNASAITIQLFWGDDPRAAMAAAARAFPVTWRKDAWEGESGRSYFELDGQLDGLKITLTAYRDAVCTRVVTGTREVTEEVPDPGALAAVPKVAVTRTVEDVTWDCGSLLAPAQCRECGGLLPGHQLTCSRIPAGPDHPAGNETTP